MPGMRKEIPKGETSNCYGGAARQEAIKALEGHGPFIRLVRKDVPKDEVCINGRFVYAIKNKPLKDGHAETDAYIDSPRRLDARLS